MHGKRMDISVPTGFRFRDARIDKAFQQIQAFRQMLAPLVRQRRDETLAAFAVAVIDDRDVLGRRRAKRPSPFAHALTEFLERTWQVESGHHSDPVVDFHFDVGIFPLAGQLYGTTSTEQAAFHQRWMQQLGVESFAYWIGADPPSRIEPDIWHLRRTVWQMLWNANGALTPPVYRGLVARCVEPYMERPDPASVLTRIPSPADRAQRTAGRALSQRWVVEHAGAPTARRAIAAAENAAAAWLRTPQGKAAIADEAKQQLPRLRVPVTLRDLTSV
jgi:hypothetical protein